MILWLALACSCSRSVSTPTEDSGASGGCEEDVAVFTEYVWTPVLSQQCVGCHVDGGQAAGTALVLDPDDMLASLRAATAVGERLLLKPTGQHESGHGGGTLVTEEGPAHEALALWVRWGQGDCELPGEDDCSDEVLSRRLRRLSHDEYDRTLTDLLDVESNYGQQLAADTTVDGYDNDAEGAPRDGPGRLPRSRVPPDAPKLAPNELKLRGRSSAHGLRLGKRAGH